MFHCRDLSAAIALLIEIITIMRLTRDKIRRQHWQFRV